MNSVQAIECVDTILEIMADHSKKVEKYVQLQQMEEKNKEKMDQLRAAEQMLLERQRQLQRTLSQGAANLADEMYQAVCEVRDSGQAPPMPASEDPHTLAADGVSNLPPCLYSGLVPGPSDTSAQCLSTGSAASSPSHETDSLTLDSSPEAVPPGEAGPHVGNIDRCSTEELQGEINLTKNGNASEIVEHKTEIVQVESIADKDAGHKGESLSEKHEDIVAVADEGELLDSSTSPDSTEVSAIADTQASGAHIEVEDKAGGQADDAGTLPTVEKAVDLHKSNDDNIEHQVSSDNTVENHVGIAKGERDAIENSTIVQDNGETGTGPESKLKSETNTGPMAATHAQSNLVPETNVPSEPEEESQDTDCPDPDIEDEYDDSWMDDWMYDDPSESDDDEEGEEGGREVTGGNQATNTDKNEATTKPSLGIDDLEESMTQFEDAMEAASRTRGLLESLKTIITPTTDSSESSLDTPETTTAAAVEASASAVSSETAHQDKPADNAAANTGEQQKSVTEHPQNGESSNTGTNIAKPECDEHKDGADVVVKAPESEKSITEVGLPVEEPTQTGSESMETSEKSELEVVTSNGPNEQQENGRSAEQDSVMTTKAANKRNQRRARKRHEKKSSSSEGQSQVNGACIQNGLDTPDGMDETRITSAGELEVIGTNTSSTPDSCQSGISHNASTPASPASAAEPSKEDSAQPTLKSIDDITSSTMALLDSVKATFKRTQNQPEKKNEESNMNMCKVYNMLLKVQMELSSVQMEMTGLQRRVHNANESLQETLDYVMQNM